MQVVEKYMEGDQVKSVRALSELEAELLLSNGQSSQQLLASLYGKWIYCDCCIPTMIKRYSETNTFFLANMNGRGGHKASCPLYRIDQQVNGENQLPAKVGTRFSFSSYSAEDGRNKESVIDNPTGQVVGRADKLYSLMASLLTDAGTNQIFLGDPLTFENHTRKIRGAARKYSIGGKSLMEYMFFGFGSIKTAIEKMETNERLWVGKNKPQSLVLAQVESLSLDDGKAVVTVKDNWEVTLPQDAIITRLNGTFSLTKGPLLLAMVIADRSTDDSMVYGVTRCFVSPIVNNKSFMLVDSDLERTFARVAIRLLIELEANAKITKPLIPIEVDGKPVIADFLVQHEKRHTAIEVMGKWDDPLYRARKETMLPLMAKAYDSVESVGEFTSKSRTEFYEESYAMLKKCLS